MPRSMRAVINPRSLKKLWKIVHRKKFKVTLAMKRLKKRKSMQRKKSLQGIIKMFRWKLKPVKKFISSGVIYMW